MAAGRCPGSLPRSARDTPSTRRRVQVLCVRGGILLINTKLVEVVVGRNLLPRVGRLARAQRAFPDVLELPAVRCRLLSLDGGLAGQRSKPKDTDRGLNECAAVHEGRFVRDLRASNVYAVLDQHDAIPGALPQHANSTRK